MFLLLAAGLYAQGTETFNNMPANASNYTLREWMGDGGIAWSATDARTDQTINGRAILIRNGSLTAAAIPNGIGNFSFSHQQEFTGSNSVLQVYINDALVGTANPTTTLASASFPTINVGGTFKLEIRQITSGLRIKIDDVTWTAFSASPCVVPTAQATALVFANVATTSATAAFTAAAPAANKYLVTLGTQANPGAVPANGTVYTVGQSLGSATVLGYGTALSYNLTGLQEGTTYYVHVFAANDLCTGGPLYNTVSPLSNSFSTATTPACVAPILAPSAFNAIAGGTTAAIAFAPAPGADGYLVLAGTAPLAGFAPVNGTTYTVGSPVGNAVVAYFGANPAALLSGLTTGTTYHVTIYPVAQFTCAGGPLYGLLSLVDVFTTTQQQSNIPAGYYDTLAGKTCAELKTTLAWRLNHDLARNPLTPRTYGDLWIEYRKSDVKPREVGPGTSPLVIWDMYSDNPTGTDPYNFTPGPISEGGQQDNGTNVSGEGFLYNREHSVPLNWFNSSGNTAPGPATDYNHIFPTDKWVNALRDSYIYGEVTNPTTTTLNGSKLGPNAFSGLTGTAFEPIDAYKGDFARAFLYFVTRYEASMPNWTGGGNGTQAFDPTTYPSVDLPYLRLMVKWHLQDPVSQKERDRNDSAYVYQGNRNPYIDIPELVSAVWNDACGILLPVNLLYFTGTQRGNVVQLDWKKARHENPLRFDVERSSNGQQFTATGTVPATEGDVYQYQDLVEKLPAGRVFYRLKAYYAGKPADYSDVVTLHLNRNTTFTVFPNPAVNSVVLDLGTQTFSGEVVVTNYAGQQLTTQKLQQAAGRYTLQLPPLPAGRYLITLRAADGSKAPVVQAFNIVR